MKKIILGVIITIIGLFSYGQTEQQINNLRTFTKVYGYVKYFHPSDEASGIDWDKFAIYGAKAVENAKDTDELLTVLDKLFKPIAPSILFYKTKDKVEYDISTIIPEKISKYKTIAWQHLGVGFGMKSKNNTYKSSRINRSSKKENSSQFGNVMTTINAEKYRGKEIKYTGNVKISEKTEGTGHLWIRVDRENNKSGFFNNMYNNPITKKSWKKYEITGKVDDDAKSIALGCFLSGKGELFVDNIELYYKDGENWIEIPIDNSDFEDEDIKDSKTTWIKRGIGYDIDISNKEFVDGKRSVTIKYIGDFEKVNSGSIFNEYPKVGELINEETGNGISCYIPLALYGTRAKTFPCSDNEEYKKLISELDEIKNTNSTNKYVRLGDIVIVWNVFQHFYPYFDVTDVDWDKELTVAFQNSYSDETENDLLYTLQEFTAHLKDGHIRVYKENNENYFPPVEWEWIENKLVITNVSEDNFNIKIGDIVVEIDDQPSKTYFNKIEKYISAATDGWKKYRAKTNSLKGKKDVPIIIKLSNGETIKLNRTLDISGYYSFTDNNSPTYKFIENKIAYLDLSKIEITTIDSLLTRLNDCKSIICDMRGYPNGNDDFISYLLEKNDTARHWMKVPKIIYPDYKKIVGFENYGWKLKAKKPHISAKIIFIIDGRAISYAESYLGFIEGYNLATIVGQPSAGTNGNINPFTLPCGHQIFWTGMKVVKHNGEQHHGVGIIPDILINKTIKGVKEGRDEFLEKAIEIAKMNN